MNNSSLIFISILLVFLCQTGSVFSKNEYNFLILRESWPATTCLFPDDNKKCEIKREVKGWAIHGLW
jgi:ribonuclease I